jgi:hypothetical protein
VVVKVSLLEEKLLVTKAPTQTNLLALVRGGRKMNTSTDKSIQAPARK